MGGEMSSRIQPVRDNHYVAYGLSKEEAAGNLTTLVRYYGYNDGVRYEDVWREIDSIKRRVRRYRVYDGYKKVYLVWNRSNDVWRCHVPL